MIAAGRAGELIDPTHPDPWIETPWLLCDCGAVAAIPRSEAGHYGYWAACSDAACRRTYRLVIVEADVVGEYVGDLPGELHTWLTG